MERSIKNMSASKFSVLVSILAIGLTSCANKKKDIPLFLTLLGGGSGKGSAVSSPAGGSTGVIAPEGSTVQPVDESTVVIHFPVEESSTENASLDSESSSSQSEESGARGEEPSMEVAIQNNDQLGTPGFHFQSAYTVPVNLHVKDESGPVQGAIVTIVDTTDNNNPDILFQQVTGNDGSVSGSVLVPATTDALQLNVNLGSSVVSSTVPMIVPSSESVASSLQVLDINRQIAVSGTHNPSKYFTDSDNDGIADAYDDYPDDPKRATLTRYPSSGVNTLAFEDLFPKAGDADLNDYVAFFSFEEDLNSQGQVVSIRGFFQHVARGAGYSHTLNLRMGVNTGAKLEMVTSKVNRNNAVVDETRREINLSASDLDNGFQILGSSRNTIPIANSSASHANNLAFGDFVNFELTFDTPVSRQSLGGAPYDVFLYVENTKHRIHMPNRYFDANGKDRFLDPNGFPWAIVIPGKWKWQLEKQDIRNPSQTGYADFMSWVNSSGQTHKEWYNNVTNPSKVFPLPDESSLAGYLAKTAQENWLLLSLALLFGGLAFGYYLTRKNSSILSR